MELNIDKTGWKKVKFGEVAIQQKGIVDIETTTLTRYIAGDHMNSSDIHLRRWGTVGDGYLGPAFIRKFDVGDILYGSRRTYLKKVAVAEFEGITSNTTFVIKANTDKINTVLLSHLMLSDSFTEHSVKNSKGSVNPYINWKDIADYEFLLPPKDQQARLAELIWAADDVVEREMEVKERLENQYSLSVEYLMKQTYDKVQLKKCTSINEKSLSSKTSRDFKLKYIDIASIIAPKKMGDLSTYTFKDAPSRARRIVKKNDLVISMVRPYLKAFVQIKSDEPNLIASTGTAVVSANENISNDYIFHTLFSKDFISHCENRMNGTNYPAITSTDLGEFSIPLPNFENQMIIADELNKIDDTLAQFDNQIAISQQLKQGLINEIF